MLLQGADKIELRKNEEKKETVESEMNAEVKKSSANFSVCLYEGEVGVKYTKGERKIINCLEEKGYAAVDCDNQIDMVNRAKSGRNFAKTAEKEEQAAVDIVQPNRDSLQY